MEIEEEVDDDFYSKLSLKGMGIKNLDFLAKFLREHPKITDIDLDLNQVSGDQVKKFAH